MSPPVSMSGAIASSATVVTFNLHKLTADRHTIFDKIATGSLVDWCP